MAKYTIERNADNTLIYRLEFLGEHFRADKTFTENSINPIEDEPLHFDKMVAVAFPKIDPDILNNLARLTTAASEPETIAVVEALAQYEVRFQNRKRSIVPSYVYMGYIPHFICRLTATGPVLSGEIKASDDVNAITYGGRTLADAMDSFRRAVNKFVAFGYVA